MLATRQQTQQHTRRTPTPTALTTFTTDGDSPALPDLQRLRATYADALGFARALRRHIREVERWLATQSGTAQGVSD